MSTKKSAILYDRLKQLPFEVRVFTMVHDCWLVGGAAAWLAGEVDSFPNDWDVIVSPEKWADLCRSFPEGTPTNTWGGLKYSFGKKQTMDAWPETLDSFMNTTHAHYGDPIAVQPRSQRVVRCEISKSDG